MINTDFQQLGSPSSANNNNNNGNNRPSAADILAAAFVANSTSASNSPPELLSLAGTNNNSSNNNSSSSNICNPFSPAAVAVQQLANAQLAAALYSSSIPSPGGSAFARLQQQVAAAAAVQQQQQQQQPQQQNNSSTVSAAVAALAAAASANSPANSTNIPQFGPGSPAATAFAQLDQLGLLRNSSIGSGLSCQNGSNEMSQIHQIHSRQSTPTNSTNSSFAALASHFQRQAAAFDNAAQVVQLLGSVTAGQQQHLIPPLSLPPSQQSQLTAAALATLAVRQQQQQQHQAVQLHSPTSLLFQEQQAQQQIQGGQAPLPHSEQQTLSFPTSVSSNSFVGSPTLAELSVIAAAATNAALKASNNNNNVECSSSSMNTSGGFIPMDTSNCVPSSSSSVGSQNQQQDDSQQNNMTDFVLSSNEHHQQGQQHHVRRIRRRRPKEEGGGKTPLLHRRNTTLGENSCVSVIEKMVDSPCSLGPFSVQQPLTPGSDLCNLLKTEGNTTEEESSVNNQQQQHLTSSTNIAMMLASMGGNGNGVGGPKTPIGQSQQQQQGQSPPSLLERQQQLQQQQQYQGIEMQQQQNNMEDDNNNQDGNNSNGRMKTCRVCGDSATGYNFNVISCESCKAFFRRNALRPKEFKCPYSNDCEINAVSRRFCQKCRLRKCFMVGMKKEWILSEDQLRKRKNARIKNQMNKDGTQQPTTPSSIGEGSMPGSVAPVTPYMGNGGNNAFSPSQQQFFHHNQHQQQQTPPPQTQFSAVAAMASILQNQNHGQAHSPLALAAAAAITKLAGSPKNSPTGASSVLSSGLDASPLASFGLSNSPDYGVKQHLLAGGGSVDNKQASPSTTCTHSPPSILPQQHQNSHLIDNEQQRYDPQVIRLAQQQLLKKAQLQQAAAVLRQSSDGLISLASAAAQQQQNQQSSPVSAVSPLVEQCHRLMLLGQQQQQGINNNNTQIIKNGDIGGVNGNNSSSSNILAKLYGNNSRQSSVISEFGSNNNSSSTISKPLLEAAAAAVAAANNAANNSNNGSPSTPNCTTNGTTIIQIPNTNGFPNLMEMDAKQRERLMSMRINRTIRDELGISMSPPDGTNTTNNSQQQQSRLSPNPIKLEERNSPHSRCNSISSSTTTSLVYTDLRNYQLNSREQSDLNAVKSAFSSMDEELKNELLKNSKLLGIMTKEQTQSPDDMMCLLDMMMRRLVKMAKKLPAFGEFSNSGKFSLLKAAMIDLLTLRGASRLDSENRCWKSPLLNMDIRCRIDIFDRLNDDMQKRRVMDFYKKLHPKLKSDQVANNLIVVTVLFSHYVDTDLSAEDRTLADKHYHNHKQLLRRYVESAYGPEEAKQIYETLDEAFSMLKDITKKVPDLFPPDKIDKKQAEGSLFLEFFRIKTKPETPTKIKIEPTEITSTSSNEELNGDECSKPKKIKIEENEEDKKEDKNILTSSSSSPHSSSLNIISPTSNTTTTISKTTSPTPTAVSSA